MRVHALKPHSLSRGYATDVVVRRSRSEIGKSVTFVKHGSGGRSSDSGHSASVFGCSGFLGRNLVNRLGKKGTAVVTPYRGVIEDVRHLKVMSDLGQMAQLRFDLRNETQIAECVRHSDTVYNLVGRDWETKNFSFTNVHVDGARNIAKMCREEGVTRLIHLSALGADVNSKSSFLRSKAEGELAVLAEFPDATIVRPTWVFGHEDRFFNRIGWLSNKFPTFIPMPGRGEATFHPVWNSDIAEGLTRLMEADNVEGRVFEFAGPRKYHYHDLIDLFLLAAKKIMVKVPVPTMAFSQLARAYNSILINPRITGDDVIRLSISDKFTPDALGFKDLGVIPSTVEEHLIKIARFYRHRTVQTTGFEDVLASKKWVGERV